MKVVNNIPFFKSELQHIYDKTSKQIGRRGTATIKAVTPVKTGKLKRAMTYEAEQISNTHFKVTFGNSLPYAEIVNLKGKHKNFFNNALEGFTPDAEAIVLKEIKSLRGIK